MPAGAVACDGLHRRGNLPDQLRAAEESAIAMPIEAVSTRGIRTAGTARRVGAEALDINVRPRSVDPGALLDETSIHPPR